MYFCSLWLLFIYPISRYLRICNFSYFWKIILVWCKQLFQSFWIAWNSLDSIKVDLQGAFVYWIFFKAFDSARQSYLYFYLNWSPRAGRLPKNRGLIIKKRRKVFTAHCIINLIYLLLRIHNFYKLSKIFRGNVGLKIPNFRFLSGKCMLL